jgi:hypothetical protein
MIDILKDDFTAHCLYLIDVKTQFTVENTLELISQITYVSPWRLKPEMDLYDTDGRIRFKIKTPLVFRRQGNESVFKTNNIAIPVTQIYLL